MATKLGAYNRALVALGERRIASLTEAREPRRVLDDLWDDCVQFCLEQGMWNFAMRTSSVASSGSGASGFTNKFSKPSDFVHLFAASAEQNFDPPLVTDFVDEGAFWYANGSTLYLRYASNDAANYGGNPAKWTQSFTTFLVYVLASWSAIKITGRVDVAEETDKMSRRYLVGALAIDSVPMLPGMRPFNADARALTVEGHTAQPIDAKPFFLPLMMDSLGKPDSGGGQ